MRILVIPDVHLKPWMFDMADEVDEETYDNVACLGDLVDDWGQRNNEGLYSGTLERAAEFASSHPGMLWCLGNHDISYIYTLMESGFSLHMQDIVVKGISEIGAMEAIRFGIIHREGRCIFSHAGITTSFVDRLERGGLVAVGSSADAVIEAVNNIYRDYYNVERFLWNDHSPIWARPQDTCEEMYGEGEFLNVVGHTPTCAPEEGAGFLSLDTFSTMGNGKPIGNQKFVIVDTESLEWKYA